MTAKQHHACQSCGGDGLREIPHFADLPRVTSDSKPFRSGGRLFVCGACGLTQKIVDERWLAEIGEIYRDYEMYHQSASNDQTVFDPVTGRPSGRCEVLARRLLASGSLPVRGALLDVGAGSGAMLGAFSGASDEWSLYGLDLDDRKAAALRAIPHFQQLFTVPPEQLAQAFELVTLIHSLEHFTEPLAMLRVLRERIAAGGRLFVEVNDAARTPFDLIVADHLCHFTPRSLSLMVARAGLGVDAVHTEWINKELSLIAAREPSPRPPGHDDPAATFAAVERDVAWLRGMLDDARRKSRSGPFGIFGTSVAATWLAAGLGDAVTFFVDEDPAREGRSHLGRPILKPAEVPAGATVYLAFVQTVAASIAHRLAGLPLTFAAPPTAA